MDRQLFNNPLSLKLLTTLTAMMWLLSATVAQAAPTGQILRGGIAINELLIDPNGSTENFDTDNNGTADTTDEYVELYNLSANTIDLSGLQLWDAGNSNWFTFPAGSQLAAGNYAVVLVGVQAGGTLPAVTDGNLAFDAGRSSGVINNGVDNVVLFDPTADQYIQLVYNNDAGDDPTTAYTGFSATAARVGSIEDFGSDSDGIALVRSPAGDDNVVLHNTVATANASPGAALSDQPGGETEVGACGGPATLISEIQGSGDNSPLVDQAVVVEAVVVGNFQGDLALDGFYVQEETADQDSLPNTSEGLFVAANTPSVAVGDIVRARGIVSEQFGLTALANATVGDEPCGSAAIEATAITLPFDEVSNNPEWYEGMRVIIPQELTVTENFNLGRFGEIVVSSGGRLFNPTQVATPGAEALVVAEANNRNRLIIDDGSFAQNPEPVIYPAPALTAENTLRSGSTVSNVTGILDFAFGNYRLQPTVAPEFINSNPREAAPLLPEIGTLRIASFNVLNYFTTLDAGTPVCGPAQNLGCRGADSATEFTRQRDKIISAIAALDADIVGLVELENNLVASLQDLVNGLNAVAGAGTWEFLDTGTIGGDAIKVGFIYKPAIAVPVGDFAILDSTVDTLFIDTKNRPALAQTFVEAQSGERLTVAVNHFKSKGSACDDVGDPDLGDGQGNCNLTRTNAAIALVNWLATDPTNSADPDVLILGDLNAYAMEDPITAITGAGYTDLINEFIGAQAYSFIFSGEAGYLDHALAYDSLLSQVTGVVEWHNNADEPRVLDYNEEFKSPQQVIDWYRPDAFRSADHDPVIVALQLASVGEPPVDLAAAIRELATAIGETEAALFVGRFESVQKARRGALTFWANVAAQAADSDNNRLAQRFLETLRKRIDGETPPTDWMVSSPEQQALAASVRALIEQLQAGE